ncbi:putative phage tail protein [Aerococcus urinaeequi]|uniref:putative phage tail protein n=1 Tax=Aerococcus urinaeequi TaxID=51665 RepID=UPI003D6B8485
MTLKQYMPAYYDGVREMNELLNIEDSLFTSYLTEFDKVKANQFIMTADLDGIEIYERILGITATTGESLGFRRSRALNRWVDIVPYTHNALYSKIARLQDNYNFDIEYELNAYRISIRTNLEIPGQVDELDYALAEMIPANLEIISRNEIPMASTANVYIVAGMTPTMLISATDSVKFDVEAFNNEMSIASTIADTALIEMTDSYHASLYTENDIAYISSAMAQISEITI